jgi:hypothetical protein
MEISNQPKLRFHGVDIVNVKLPRPVSTDGRGSPHLLL